MQIFVATALVLAPVFLGASAIGVSRYRRLQRALSASHSETAAYIESRTQAQEEAALWRSRASKAEEELVESLPKLSRAERELVECQAKLRKEQEELARVSRLGAEVERRWEDAERKAAEMASPVGVLGVLLEMKRQRRFGERSFCPDFEKQLEALDTGTMVALAGSQSAWEMAQKARDTA